MRSLDLGVVVVKSAGQPENERILMFSTEQRKRSIKSNDVWIEIVQKKPKKKYEKLQTTAGKDLQIQQIAFFLDLALRCPFDECDDFFEKTELIVKEILDMRLQEHVLRRKRLISSALKEIGSTLSALEECERINFKSFCNNIIDSSASEAQDVELDLFEGGFEIFSLETSPLAFKPSFNFWIPVSKCHAIPIDQPPMFQFIPYFGDENGIGTELAQFLQQTLNLMEPPSPEEALEHELIGEILCISDCTASRLQSAWKSSEDECTKRELVFSRFLKFCFPDFDPQYLDVIESNLPKEIEAELEPPKALHRAFRCHFCRKCFKFGCLDHSDAVFPATLPANVANKEKKQFEPEECINCYKFNSEQNKPIELIPIEQEILKKCISLGFSPCEIASYMEIECAEMFAYLRNNFPSTIIPRFLPTLAAATSSATPERAHVAKPQLLKKYPVDIDATQRIPHVPCYHPGRECNESCACVNANMYCEKYCFCSDGCLNRFPGCNCTGPCINTVCPCYAAIRECDPDLCKKCCSTCPTDSEVCGMFGTKNCRNTAIQQGLSKRILIAKSFVDGLGAFAGESIKESEFICEYLGERVPEDEAERRGRIYDDYGCSYLFKLDREHTIDATILGAPIKFANHSNVNQNCYAKIVSVNGEYRIGIYALRAIAKGEELLFDYGYCKELKKFVNKDLPKRKK